MEQAQKELLLNTIKNGMKAEMDAILLYKQGLENARHQDVQQFFMDWMQEEQRHYNYLLTYYNQVNKGEQLSDPAQMLKEETSEPTHIPDDVVAKISADPALYSAISLATRLEKEAFEFYRWCAEETTNIVLKQFYTMMIDFEQQHYQDLLTIADELEKKFWTENRFSPF